MSGLFGFFQKFMPHKATDGNYNTSLVDRPPPVSAEKEVDNDEVSAADEVEHEDLCEYTEELDYKQWKKRSKNKLRKFLKHRIFQEDDDKEEEEDETTDESSLSSFEEDTNDTTTPHQEDSFDCGLETQQQPHISGGAPDSQEAELSQKAAAKHHRKQIPHVEDTVHKINLVEDLDLYTKEATIEVAMATRLVELRPIKRKAVVSQTPRSLPVLGSTKTLPRFSNAPLECDGPLSTIYSENVLNLDISQLHLEPISQARRAAAAAAPPSQAPQKIRVFFYDDYATAIHQALQDYNPEKHTLLIQIQKVSACSILPYAYEHWPEQQDRMPLCLCIGGPSIVLIQGECNEDKEPLRFDNEDLRIRIAVGDKESGEFREWKLQDAELVEVASSTLTKKFQHWQEQWGIGLDDDEEEVDPNDNTEPMDTDADVVTNTNITNGDKTTETSGHSPPTAEASNVTERAKESNNDSTANNKSKAPSAATAKTTANREAAPSTAAAAANAATNGTDDKENNTNAAPAKDKATGATSTAKEKATNETSATSKRASSTRAARPAAWTASAQSPKARRQFQEPSTEEPPAKRLKAKNKYFLMNQLRSVLEEHKAAQRNWTAYTPVVGTGKGSLKSGEANLYGLVLGFSAPVQSNRGDWQVNVTLVDATIFREDDPSAAAVTLVIFCKDRKRLPDLRMPGEVLRLHRVIVQEWAGELQLLGQRSTGYALFRGGDTFSADRVVAPGNRSFAEEDEERFPSLWKWGQQRLNRHTTMKASAHLTISQLRQQDDNGKSSNEPDLIGDLTVMLSAVIPMPDHLRSRTTPTGFLRVWDGTGSSQSDRFARQDLTGRSFDPPSEALVAISKIKEIREGRPTLPIPHRLCGRVVNVVIWEVPHWEFITKGEVKIGDFIRLRNVREQFSKVLEMNCLLVEAKSWLTPLPPTAYDVLELLQNHGQRVVHNHPVNLASGVLPLDETHTTSQTAASSTQSRQQNPATNTQAHSRSQHKSSQQKPSANKQAAHAAKKPAAKKPVKQKCSTIQMLKSTPSSSTFKGSVFIEAIIPPVRSAHDIRKLCQQVKGNLDHKYQFALFLHDGKTAVNAIVSNAVGEQFFEMPAKDARNGPDSAFDVLSCIKDRRRWDVEVRSFQTQGKWFFLLSSISKSSLAGGSTGS